MRFSYILFHSSNAYEKLKNLSRRNIKNTERVFFEEVGMLDRVKNRDSIGAVNFKAMSNAEQTKYIKDILYL